MGTALAPSSHSNEKGYQFLDQIVTGDESFIHNWKPILKQASMSRKLKHEKAQQKFKEQTFVGEVIFTAFWDQQEILQEYLY